MPSGINPGRYYSAEETAEYGTRRSRVAPSGVRGSSPRSVPMDRRTFLRRAALIAAGVAAADQIDLLERLTHKKLWSGWSPAPEFVFKEFELGFLVSQEMIEDDLTYQLSEASTFAKNFVHTFDSSIYTVYVASNPNRRG